MAINALNSDVSAITALGNDVQEVTVDGTTVWTATQLVDSFEDGNLSEYTGSTSGLSVVSDSGLSFSAIDGSNVLEAPNDNTTRGIESTSGLDNYYSKGGGTYRVYIRWNAAPDSNSETRTQFGAVDSDNHYDAVVSPDPNELMIREYDSGNQSTLVTSTSGSYSADTWYYLDIDWFDGTGGRTDGDIDVSIKQFSDDSEVDSVTANSTANNGSGIGFTAYSPGVANYYWDYAHII